MKSKYKIVIAPDSFKGSLSAVLVCDAIERGFNKACPVGVSLDIIKCPIADGGEGTLETLVKPENMLDFYATSTDFSKIPARIGYINDTAVIEMATTAGLTLVCEGKRDVLSATTYGVGESVLHALNRGFTKILLTVGGSGTNDGGCGMFSALGAKFLDKNDKPFIPVGGTLANIRIIDTSPLDKRLLNCEFTIACDVTNPLTGKTGATEVYSRQKGADERAVDIMERGMIHYANILQKESGIDVRNTSGCGAGGGISAPLLAYTNAEIKSGILAVLDSLKFNTLLENADFVITGEGKIDSQSVYGKAISGVAKAAKANNIPVYCFVGSVGEGSEKMRECGVSDIISLCDIAESKEYAIANAAILLEEVAYRFILKYFI